MLDLCPLFEFDKKIFIATNHSKRAIQCMRSIKKSYLFNSIHYFIKYYLNYSLAGIRAFQSKFAKSL